MSFGFLPLPAYVAMCLGFSITLLYYVIKRRNKDRKGLIVLYLTGAVGGVIVAIGKIVKEMWGNNSKYYDYMAYIVFGYLALFFIELFYLSITHKGDEESKRKLLIGWGMILACIVIGVVAYLILG